MLPQWHSQASSLQYTQQQLYQQHQYNQQLSSSYQPQQVAPPAYPAGSYTDANVWYGGGNLMSPAHGYDDPYYGSYSTLAAYNSSPVVANQQTHSSVEMQYHTQTPWHQSQYLPEWMQQQKQQQQHHNLSHTHTSSPSQPSVFGSDASPYDLGFSAIVMGQQPPAYPHHSPSSSHTNLMNPPPYPSSTTNEMHIPPPIPPRKPSEPSLNHSGDWIMVPSSPAKPPSYSNLNPSPPPLLPKKPILRLHSSERYALEGQFQKYDKNGDNKMDREEFRGSLGLFFTSSQANASVWYGGLLADFLFRAFDTDADGYIACDEFVNAIAVLRYGTAVEKLDLAWRVIDVQRRGYITPEDLSAVVKSMYSVLASMKIEIDYYGVDWWVNAVFERLQGPIGCITRESYLGNALNHHRLITGLGLSQYDYYYYSSPAESSSSSSSGEALVLFGDDIFSWLVAMMLGIRLAGQRTASKIRERSNTLTQDDFSSKATFILPNNASSSLYIPFVNATTFFDYSPIVFFYIRRIYGLDEREYLVLGNSLVGNLGALKMQVSQGKSGSYFFKSRDQKLFVKTISLREEMTLKRILPGYYKHLEGQKHTLLSFFFGFHKENITPMIVMNNAFNTRLPIHDLYDLKGSTTGRTNQSGKGILKDLDLKRVIRVGPVARQQLLGQIERDVRFLEQMELIDYSLLVGIHYRDRAPPSATPPITPNTLSSSRQPPFHQQAEGGMLGLDEYGRVSNEVYFFGIIDILTFYGLMKTTETLINSVLRPSGNHSCVPPSDYAARFLAFLNKVIL